MSKACFCSSSVGRKVFMAITGAFLVIFMLLHMSLNLFVIGGAESYNAMCHFMGLPFIKYGLQPVLALGFIVHIFYGLYLALKNKAARPLNYKNANYGAASSWASRYMWLTGLVVLGGIALHMVNFWVKIQITGLPVGVEGIKDEDIPQMIEWAMKEANPLYPVPDIWDEDDFRKLIESVRA